ncbi:MAG TPA: tetraacyldisaccharide 4'-kinase [Micropepsaceae bacterium]|nr:tetraacyldisaccharide 4'-kinase [Micropepsaceae bacterium]
MRAPEFWYGPSPAHGWVRGLLMPASAIYGAAGWLERRFSRAHRTSVPVICVGNLTLGGTGKSPVAAAIAAMARNEGYKPFILMRGYRGRLKGPVTVTGSHTADDVGDEACMHAAQTRTVVSVDRVKGAEHSVREGATLIIMDDGFQNPALAKDLSLIVVDAGRGFGNRTIFPAGPLREGISGGLGRAQGVILMGNGAAPAEVMASRLPVFRAHLRPVNGHEFKGKRVAAFAGIGRPEKFFATLEDCGAEIVGRHAFDDHARISAAALEMLARAAREANAMLVTTEKDYCRLGRPRAGVHVLKVEAVFDDPTAFGRLLSPLLARTRP